MSCVYLPTMGVVLAWLTVCASLALAQDGWSVRTLRVAQETRLDWAYPLLGRSPDKAPAELAPGYRSTAQEYELHGPDEDGVGGKRPLVIFISPSDRPVGWRLCEPTCRRHGVLLADLIGMGNGKPVAHRVRAVLDVLDDVRRRYDIDPDRTYLAGFSGGAHVACTVGLHLPEYVAGVVAVGYAPLPVNDEAVVARIRRRLSLAIVVGDREPAAAVAENYVGPWWSGVGVRTELNVLRRHGHTLPAPNVFEEAFAWLEEDVANRRAASHRADLFRHLEAATRTEQAEAALSDARVALQAARDDEAVESALLNLEVVAKRWPDLPAAKTAQSLLDEYTARPERPWEAVREARRVRTISLHADGLEKLAHRRGRAVANQQVAYANAAIAHLRQLRETSREPAFVSKVDERIAALDEIVAASPPESAAVPLTRVRFDMNGDVTLAEAIAYLRTTLARLGYELVVDEAALREAGVDLEKQHRPRLRSVDLNELDRRFLRRTGVKLQRSGKTIRLLPVAPAADVASAAERPD